MKNTLLITASVAALVAGIGLASAQIERKEAPAATTSEPKASEGQAGQQKSTLPQKNEKMKPGTTVQVPEKVNPNPATQAQERAKPLPTVQSQEKAKPVPTAQTQERAKPIPTAQAPQNMSGSDHPTVGQAPAKDAVPNATTQKGAKSFASAPITTEQNVKIRDSLKGEKAEHLNNVTFSISIGETVPRSVHYYRLPARVVEYAPQYRDFDYILVGDDILILDPRTHRIVAVISA